MLLFFLHTSFVFEGVMATKRTGISQASSPGPSSSLDDVERGGRHGSSLPPARNYARDAEGSNKYTMIVAVVLG